MISTKTARSRAIERAARFAAKRKERRVEDQVCEAADKLLRRYDKNQNGFIDLNELVADRKDVGIIDEDRFIEFDWDENQKLWKMEVATYLAQQRKKTEKSKPDPFR